MMNLHDFKNLFQTALTTVPGGMFDLCPQHTNRFRYLLKNDYEFRFFFFELVSNRDLPGFRASIPLSLVYCIIWYSMGQGIWRAG